MWSGEHTFIYRGGGEGCPVEGAAHYMRGESTKLGYIEGVCVLHPPPFRASHTKGNTEAWAHQALSV